MTSRKPISSETGLQVESLKAEISSEREAFLKKSEEVSALKTKNQHLEELLAEAKEEKSKLDENLSAQFENMANRVLDQQSKSLNTLNSKQVSEILSPLQTKITDFQKTIRDNYQYENEQRTTLKSEIANNLKMNQQLSQDAQNLTKALKGDMKLQGDFGELKLERVLESAGLQKDKEYTAQLSLVSEDNKRQIPDYVIHLPEKKSLIIDSKVTLNSWIAITECTNKSEVAALQKTFFTAIKKHVDTLHSKKYHDNASLNTVDFVLMYIPFENTYQYIYEHNHDLILNALEKGVVIASSSTLLTCLKTVSTIWRKEYQDRNAEEIAAEGGKLYNKFVGFLEDMEKIGNSIGKAQEQYDSAYNKLSDGSGNLVRRAEKLRKLGAKVNKKIPEVLVEKSNSDKEYVFKK